MLKHIPRSQYPLCQTCGTRVKARRARFCRPECIPKAERRLWAQKGRKTYAYRRRAILLKRHLDRLGRHFTREELVTVMWEYGKHQYNNGFQAAKIGSRLEDAVERGAA